MAHPQLETYEEYEENMRDLFTIFVSCDKDGNGVLDSIELQSFLRQSKIMDSVDETERKFFFEKVFKKADHNNTGTIDFQVDVRTVLDSYMKTRRIIQNRTS